MVLWVQNLFICRNMLGNTAFSGVTVQVAAHIELSSRLQQISIYARRTSVWWVLRMLSTEILWNFGANWFSVSVAKSYADFQSLINFLESVISSQKEWKP